MGGEVWVDSVEGEGSVFGFRVEMDVAGDSPTNALPDWVESAVIIDHLEAQRDILNKQLAALGVLTRNFTTAGDVLEAKPEADVVLLSADLPDTDVAEFIADLREVGIHAPVLLMVSGIQGAGARNVAGTIPLQRPLLRGNLCEAMAGLEPKNGTNPEIGDEGPPSIMENDEDGTEGRGAAVDVVRDALSEANLAPTNPNAARRKGPRPMRILAAEDNKTNQLVFGKMLKSLDIDLKFASNGREAIDLYKSFSPDLVFMDISMPEVDGKEATRKIRRIEETTGRHVPIVAMTAHAMAGDEEEILSHGLDHYMTKPLRKAAIIDRILMEHVPECRPVAPMDDPPAEVQGDSAAALKA